MVELLLFLMVLHHTPHLEEASLPATSAGECIQIFGIIEEEATYPVLPVESSNNLANEGGGVTRRSRMVLMLGQRALK